MHCEILRKENKVNLVLIVQFGCLEIAIELGISRGFSVGKNLRNRLGKFYAGSGLLPLCILPAAAAEFFTPATQVAFGQPFLPSGSERAELSAPQSTGTSAVQPSLE